MNKICFTLTVEQNYLLLLGDFEIEKVDQRKYK